ATKKNPDDKLTGVFTLATSYALTRPVAVLPSLQMANLSISDELNVQRRNAFAAPLSHYRPGSDRFDICDSQDYFRVRPNTSLQTLRAFNATHLLGGIALIISHVAFAGFEPAVNYPVNPSPTAIVTGDFDRDGHLDLVVTGCGDRNCTTTGSVIVLLGDGRGRFIRSGQFVAGPSGTTADRLASGDFNGDGTPDLVVANNAINQFGTISILLGDGVGGFLSPVSYSVGGSTPVWVEVADFNRDHKLDLAVSVTTTNSVAVLLGNGDGTFQPADNYTVGSSPQGIAIGDVTRDGFPDIISADECGDEPECRNGTVSVLLGNGDGTFRPRLVFAEGLFPLSVRVADFNGDHNLDLAIANPCGTDGTCVSLGSVGIMLGNGD